MIGAAAQAQRPRIERQQAAVVAALLALASVAWWASAERMAGMDSGPTTELGGLGFYLGVWVLMMAAMMFPSVWPLVALYDGLRRRRGLPTAATALVVAGYLAAWLAAGLAAFGVVAAGAAVAPDALAWDEAGHWLAAGVVAGAAVYQLTPLKHACLRRCRGPLMFVMENWRPGALGAARLGARHGAWCVGCCWALMAALFALGVMSVGWMAFVAALIATEKLLPWRRVANLSVAFVLLVVAALLAVEPGALPWLPDASADAAMPMPMPDGHSGM